MGHKSKSFMIFTLSGFPVSCRHQHKHQMNPTTLHEQKKSLSNTARLILRTPPLSIPAT